MKSPKEHNRGKLPEGQDSSSAEINDLKAQLMEMQMEIDILKETMNILKKCPHPPPKCELNIPAVEHHLSGELEITLPDNRKHLKTA